MNHSLLVVVFVVDDDDDDEGVRCICQHLPFLSVRQIINKKKKSGDDGG